MKVWKIVLVFTTWISTIQAASRDEWKSRSIYQIVTDRFALSNGSTNASCDAAKGLYCGGTFRGIIEKLDYIQDLGFSAVSISFSPDFQTLLRRNTPWSGACYTIIANRLTFTRLQIWISPITYPIQEVTSDLSGASTFMPLGIVILTFI